MRFSPKVVGGCRPRGGQHSTGAGHKLPESIPLGQRGRILPRVGPPCRVALPMGEQLGGVWGTQSPPSSAPRGGQGLCVCLSAPPWDGELNFFAFPLCTELLSSQ